jgi:hypothetical protein
MWTAAHPIRKLAPDMSDDPSKLILAETAVSAMEESPRRRLLRRRKAGEGQPITECENCGAQLHGHWCAKCGQAAVEYRRSFRHVILDILDSFLNWDSKFFATLAWLIVKPWHLTNEFVRGHRVRYLHPIRLYLLASILFFFVVNYWAKSIHMETPHRQKLTPEQRLKIEEKLKNKDLPAEIRDKVKADLNEASQSPSPSAEQTPAPAAEKEPTTPSKPTEPLPATATEPDQEERPLIQFDPSDGGGTRFERWLERQAKEKLGEHGTKAGLFLKTLVSNMPYMMLCCIPLFALVLKLLYIRRRIFYIDHLVYALHVHSFAYAALMVIGFLTMGINRVTSGALAGWLIAALWIAFAVQIFLSIRRVYRQGWIKTIIKFWLGGAVYLVILLLGLAATFFATLVTP